MVYTHGTRVSICIDDQRQQMLRSTRAVNDRTTGEAPHRGHTGLSLPLPPLASEGFRMGFNYL